MQHSSPLYLEDVHTYNWSPSGGTNATASNLLAGSYTVTVTDVNSCTHTATIIVTTTNGPAVTLSFQTNILCNGGNNGSATINASGGTAPYTYLWSNTQSNAVATGLGAGTYTVTVTDAAGCASTQVVTITEPTVIVASSSSTNANCGNNDGTASVNASGGTLPYTYLWNTGATTSQISNLSSQIYSVTITDANGCTQTASTTVGATGGPIADAGINVTIEQGNSTILNASGGTGFVWSPSTGLSCTACQSPTASPTGTTTYYVIVTDLNGCNATDSVTVFVEFPCNTELLSTLMPNAFSPNADGQNDRLCVPDNVCVLNFILKIYDRWGEKVFETESLSNCWDGSYKTKELNTAVFVYYLEAILSNGEKFNQQGNISLIK